MIAGLCVPSGGSIMLDDETFFDAGSTRHPVEPENRDIGMVFQSYAVWPHMNAFDNVAYPLKLRKVKRDEIARKVDTILKVVHLDGYEKRMAHELSGGQQQRVALARALVMNPRLLLLDEPLSNLDAALRDEMRGEIKEIQRNLGITIINVTHDQIEAMTMSDKVAVMNAGRLIQFGSPHELYEHPVNTFVARFIGSANILPATRDPEVAPDQEGMMQVLVMDRYPVRVPFVLSAGRRGFIAARAHHIKPDEQSGFSGTIRRRLYQGVLNEYHIDLGDGKLHRFTTDVGYTREIGDEASIHIEKALWLDE
jgi:iron(III) transport system ATP-binding protein